MSVRKTLILTLGATLLAAACSSPTGPRGDCDVITMGSSRCVAN